MKTVFPTLLASFSTITAAFTTRQGGISKAPYTSANLAFHVGDNPDDVVKNHDLLAQALSYDRQALLHMRQIHSDRVVLIDETLNFDSPPECDALITNLPNTPLMVMSADCTPILLYDPVHQAIAAIHAGRAGALGEILPKTVRDMKKHFGSLPADIHAVLGPSIHGCCYEINSSIANETQTKGYSEALRFDEERIFLDVNTILGMQIKKLGIEKVEVIQECTSCHHDRYFSYRADHQHTGRIAGVIILR